MLLLCRVIQGAGGGGLQPMAQAIMADSFDEKKRGQAFALYGLVAVLAPSIGPTMGGWITDNYNWRWIFYINIPVGILAFVLVTRFVEDPPWIKAIGESQEARLHRSRLSHRRHGRHADHARQGRRERLARFELHSNVCGPVCLGMIGLIWREWRAKNPIMNLKLFKFKNFAIVPSSCFGRRTSQREHRTTAAVLPGASGLHGDSRGRGAYRRGPCTADSHAAMAGIASGKFAARNLAVAGFAFFAVAFYYSSTHVTLSMSFGFGTWLRCCKWLPIPFALSRSPTPPTSACPKRPAIRSPALSTLPAMWEAASSFLITGALVMNRSLFHQNRLGDHMQAGNPVFAQPACRARQGVWRWRREGRDGPWTDL
jgi:MFS transporter, DHA2 family, multidrug resistance protein